MEPNTVFSKPDAEHAATDCTAATDASSNPAAPPADMVDSAIQEPAVLTSHDPVFLEKAREARTLERRAERTACLWTLGLVASEATLLLCVENRFFKLVFMLLVFLLFIPLSLIGSRTRNRIDTIKRSLGLSTQKTIAEQVPELSKKG